MTRAHAPDRPSRVPIARSPGRAFVVLFLVAFAVRTFLLFSWMTPDRLRLPETTSEIGAVAETLARTGRFADPYGIHTGPTAHPQPLFTFLLAGLYRILGFGAAAGLVRCLFGIAAYSAIPAMLPWFAARVGLNPAAGLLAGLFGALLPREGLAEVIGWSANEPLAALALAGMIVAFARRWSGGGSERGALVLGLGAGIAFHLMPQLVLVFLGLLGYEALRVRRPRRGRSIALALVGAVLVCAPWTARNLATFGEPFFLRSNFGLELRLGNHEGAVASMDGMDRLEGDGMRHPRNNATEALRVRELGEAVYMREARNEAIDWIRRHPADFVRLTGRRFLLFWFGALSRSGAALLVTAVTLLAIVGAGRHLPSLPGASRAVLLVPLVAYPLVHYVVAYMSRYTVPVGWIVLLLAGAAFFPGVRTSQREARPG
jgi:hypothetical protein